MQQKKNDRTFDKFTNQYALSKTLRFELKPVGKTLENMRDHLKFDPKLQTFLRDQEIEDAYQTLKPVFDALHEEFINESLESKVVAMINFSDYLDKYKRREELGEKELEKIEKLLRIEIGKAYGQTAKLWKERAGKNEKDKDILTETGFKILTESGILEYIRKNAAQFSGIKTEEEILNALGHFKGFFTYLSGFNQNRENYYVTKDEKATAVATRIVSDNLPRFCDNLILFAGNQNGYLDIYNLLKTAGNSLVDKDDQVLEEIKSELFKIEYFNKCLSQHGIEAYNKQISNANFLINLYNQSKSKEDGFKKLSLFKTLYKQIGCGEKKSLFFELTHNKKAEAEIARKDDKDAFSVEEILQLADLTGKRLFVGETDDGLINTVPELLSYLMNKGDYSGVYWSKVAVNSISNKYFANWYELKEKLRDAKIFNKGKKGDEEEIKIPEVVELQGLFEVLDGVEDWQMGLFKNSILEDAEKKSIIERSNSASEALLELIFDDITKCSKLFSVMAHDVLKLKGYTEEDSKHKIKIWMDQALTVNQMLKYFVVRANKIKGAPVDSTLTEGLNNILNGEVDFAGQKHRVDWFKWYDAVRNYLTRKPQDDAKKNKLKLNFENSNLAGGWDMNKESANSCIILRDPEKRQYLAIIAKPKKPQKGHNKIFEKNDKNTLYDLIQGNEVWQKMNYKLLPGPNKMLPKCLLPGKNRFKYGATLELLEVYDKGLFKKGVDFSKESLFKVIDFYKKGLEKYEDWQCFNFKFKETKDYQDISQFYTDVEKQGYRLSFVNVDKSVLDGLVDQGKIYLFEIKNQDNNANKKTNHQDNLHTLYWNAVFEDVLNKPKLNGEAEVFYRKALSKDKLEWTNDHNGKEVIKNYRFSKEKFLFHVPITLNFCLKDLRMNDLAKEELSKNTETTFLGIDRGEKHLAYYYLVDQNGIPVKDKTGKTVQGTLNLPFVDQDGNPRIIKVEKRVIDKDGNEKKEIVECKDYNEMLIARAGDRDFARKNWQTIGTIKKLKEGYISQAIRKIADLAMEHKAFIVMEDLNTGFKRGRQKIENSVYQKFELALAKKLNFLVDKKVPLGEVGSVTRALQLTPPVTNYGDIENRKQVGIMLYTRANYTSQTDPVTGWRKRVYLQKGSEDKIKEQIIEKFTEITFDGKDYCFEYKDGLGKKWRLYSGKNGKSLDRYRGYRDKAHDNWTVVKINLMEILDGIFVDFDKSRSLLAQIVDEDLQLAKVSAEHTAWESLRFALDLIQQIRNTGESGNQRDTDFLQSPIRDENEDHFDSREVKEGLPTSGDANGAFNIARKGVLMNEHIKRNYGLLVRDEEWDAWLAGKDIWENWIKDNKKLLTGKRKIR